MVTVSVDGSVLDRIAKIMSYLRLGSSGKVLKKKRKEKDGKGFFFIPYLFLYFQIENSDLQEIICFGFLEFNLVQVL